MAKGIAFANLVDQPTSLVEEVGAIVNAPNQEIVMHSSALMPKTIMMQLNEVKDMHNNCAKTEKERLSPNQERT